MGAGRRKRARERQKERLALGWVLKGSLLEVMFKLRCDDRKEPASKLVSRWIIIFPQPLPSTQALLQEYLQGNQLQNSDIPSFIIKAFRARTEEIAMGILTAPSRPATVHTGFLQPRAEV